MRHRSRIAKLQAEAQARADRADLIERDAVWKAKRAALREGVSRRAVRRPRAGIRRLSRPRGPQPRRLRHLVCARREIRQRMARVARGAAASGQSMRSPSSPATHADAVDFHRWLQWQLDDQLTAAQATAVQAGMDLGIMHDLAVGVDPNGADAWALQDVLALGVTAGAPPDEFNQLGQDWSQPPWRPDELVEQAYAPFRALVNAALRHAGGVRIDHIIGLFRLWWIPKGVAADRGHLRALRPRGDDRHRRAGGTPGRCGGRRRGSRHRRAVGARLPARSRPVRHLDPVVRIGPRRRRRSTARRAVARVLPVVGDHPRPAADRRLPGR